MLCLVGESGCGKTTTGKMMAGLLKPIRGQDLLSREAMSGTTRQEGRGFQKIPLGVQIIHQDPYARSTRHTQSTNP